MKPPSTQEVRDYFHKNGFADARGERTALWIPTKTRNELIEEEGFSAKPKMTVQGKVYRMKFTSIGGGMWQMELQSLS